MSANVSRPCPSVTSCSSGRTAALKDATHPGNNGIIAGLWAGGSGIGSSAVKAFIRRSLHVQNPVLPSAIPARLCGLPIGAVGPVVSEFRGLDLNFDEAQAARRGIVGVGPRAV